MFLFVPWYVKNVSSGANFRISFCQLLINPVGTTTKTFFLSKILSFLSFWRNTMVCNVLPRPMSSAKILPKPNSWFLQSQSKPRFWYGLKTALIFSGTGVCAWFLSFFNKSWAVLSNFMGVESNVSDNAVWSTWTEDSFAGVSITFLILSMSDSLM